MHLMARSGLQAGDRVVVAIGNGPQFVAALGAVLTQQGAPLLLHARTPAQELHRTALRYGARFILCDECGPEELESIGCRVAPLAAGVSWLAPQWVTVDTDHPAFDSSLPRLPGVPLHPTSGTTGQPKIAVRPGHCAVEEARHYIDRLGVTSRDRVLIVAPMSHAYAYGMGFMVPLLSGAQVVSTRSFNARLVHQAFGQNGITVFPAVPAMLDVLLFGAGDRLRDPSRCVLTAGSPLPERTASRYREASGAFVRPLYGTTETGGISICHAGPQATQVGCVGRPLRDVSVKVCSHAGGADLGEGVGMLYVKSTSMMAGYLGREGIDTSPLQDGWFKTGDLAQIDSQGAIHLKGRDSEVINVAGMKVIPCDVEEVIASLAGVVEVKVYAGQTRGGSQFVKAAVVMEDGIDIGAVRRHCEQHLVYYKRPDRVFRLEALPRSPAGKIIGDQLP